MLTQERIALYQSNQAIFNCRQFLEFIQTSEKYCQISQKVRECLIVNQVDGRQQIVVNFPEITERKQDKNKICNKGSSIFYYCLTCSVRSVFFCKLCFDQSEHIGHAYKDYKSQDNLCACENVMHNISQKQCLAHQKQELKLQSAEIDLINFYESYSQLVSLLFQQKLDRSAQIFLKEMLTHFSSISENNMYYCQLIGAILKKKIGKVTILQFFFDMPFKCIQEKMKNVLKNLFRSEKIQVSVYQTISQFSSQKKVQKALEIVLTIKSQRLKALFCVINCQNSQIKANKSILKAFKQVLNSISLRKKAKIKPLLFQIFNSLDKLNVFENQSGLFSILSAETTFVLQKLAQTDCNRQLFAKLSKKRIISILKKRQQGNKSNKKSAAHLTSIVSPINFLFRLLFQIFGGKQSLIIKYFKDNEFTIQQMNKIIQQYFKEIIEEQKFEHINVFSVRMLTALSKQFEITLIFPNLWEKFKITQNKIVKFLKKLLQRQFSLSSSLYNIRLRRKILDPKIRESSSGIDQYWLKQLLSTLKTLRKKYIHNLYDVQYLNFPEALQIINTHTQYNQQLESFIYIHKNKYQNYDFFLHKLLKNQINSQINLNQFNPKKIINPEIQEFQINLQYYCQSKFYEVRRDYLNILSKGMFHALGQIYEKNLKKNQTNFVSSINNKVQEFYELTKIVTILDAHIRENNIGLMELKNNIKKVAELLKYPERNIDSLLQINRTKMHKIKEQLQEQSINIDKKQIQEIQPQKNLSAKALKMKKLKEKFNNKASQIRKNFISENNMLLKKQQQELNNNEDAQTCIVCRQSAKIDNPLFYISRIQQNLIDSLLFKKKQHSVLIIDSCFHKIHFSCFSGYIEKRKQKCPLCTATANILLPLIENNSSDQVFFQTSAFAKFFQNDTINKAEDIFQIFYQTLIFENSQGLFRIKKQEKDKFNSEYFLTLIGQLFQTQEDFSRILQKIQKVMKENSEKNINKALGRMESILINLFGSILKNYGELSKQSCKQIARKLQKLWQDYQYRWQIKLFIENIKSIVPQICITFDINWVEGYRTDKDLIFNANIPLTMQQAFSLRKKCQKNGCQRLKTQICLICRTLLCQFCTIISEHCKKQHNFPCVLLGLETGTIYTKNNKVEKRCQIFENGVRQNYQTQPFLDGFNLNTNKYRKFIYQWLFSIQQTKEQPKVQAQDDW